MHGGESERVRVCVWGGGGRREKVSLPLTQSLKQLARAGRGVEAREAAGGAAGGPAGGRAEGPSGEVGEAAALTFSPSVKAEAVEPEQWLQRHPEAGSSDIWQRAPARSEAAQMVRDAGAAYDRLQVLSLSRGAHVVRTPREGWRHLSCTQLIWLSQIRWLSHVSKAGAACDRLQVRHSISPCS